MKYRIIDRKANTAPHIIKLSGTYFFIDSKKKRKKTNSKVKEINQNSNLPVKLLTPHYHNNKRISLPYVRSIDNYMSFDYYTKDYTAIFSGYPTDENDCRLTRIEFLTDKYDLCGISVGSDISDAEKILKGFGFENAEISEYDAKFYYEDICVSIKPKGKIIAKLSVKIKTYYVGNYIY